MSEASYAHLAGLSARIEKLAESGHWEACAVATEEMLALLKSGLPAARTSDRAAIEQALNSLAAINERAEPLRADISRLLKAFGMQPPTA